MSNKIVNHSKILYTIKDLTKILLKLGDIDFIHTNKKIEYANIPCSFDIETSSFYQNSNQIDSKTAIMYEWTLCLDGYTIIGRTWEEFLYACSKIQDFFSLDDERAIIIYVHNLGYEFQFFRKLFDWSSIFSLEKRKPVKARNLLGIEFRCSYILSGYSVENLSKQLHKYKFEKKVGYLDYNKIRHSNTYLTKNELEYCSNDCLVVVAYIQELIEKYGDITKLPLTKTGFVRNACRNACYTDNNKSHKYTNYRKIMNSLTLDVFTYKQLKKAFAGGFTHASLLHSTNIIEEADSFDFGSSYPYVICSEKFPMSKPEYHQITSKEDLLNCLNKYCCVFDIEFEDIEPKLYFENYISKSKCWSLHNYEENNGRIIRASKLSITITEQDFAIINKFYKFKKMRVFNFIRFKKDYLPTDFIKFVLKEYNIKTKLKGVEGKEIEYAVSKENVNSLYGMMVTDIARSLINYTNNEWSEEKPNLHDEINKYNKSVKRFLFYPWGVWVTAYARRNLFTGIIEFDEDYLYADTDSLKGINIELHSNYIDNYNRKVREKLDRACEYHKINPLLTRPKNIKGEEKQLGVWEHETKDGKYTKFKTLGAKRYLYEQNGKYHLTVAGLGKKQGMKYMEENFDDVFESFNEGLYIPKGETGKNTHTYIDEEREGYVKDYLGQVGYYKELSSVHLEPSDYSLSLSDSYAELLLNIHTTEV